MENVNVVALVVAVLGAGGIGVFFRELVSIITLIRTGVSAKEANRKNDLVAQRDREFLRAEAADTRADTEGRNRRTLQEYVSVLRRRLLDLGLPLADLPPEPELEPIPPVALPTAAVTPPKE